MAMLKTLARKFGGCKQIKDYLARNGRAVTFRSSSIELDGGDWDDQDWSDWDEGNTGPDENRRPAWPGDADDESWPTEEDWQNFFDSGSWGWENT